ncbi:MAG: restriction endonuclease, partial [Parcubacteria group bacterium]|nr:restriction endonuclease [Parcubacteria group bacterium]
MTKRIKRNKWILYRHTRDFNLVIKVAELLKTQASKYVGKKSKVYLQNQLANLGLYNERNPNKPLDAINHKINTLCFYMFGHKENWESGEKFIFSPLGNLFLKNKKDKKKRRLIFSSMLWSIQFEHPHSGTDRNISLFPFRFIYKLLLDSRIENKLFAFEIAYLIVFVQKVSINKYEEIIEKIIKLRRLNNDEVLELFSQDKHAYVNASYEWDYYMSNVLKSELVLDKTLGEVIGKIQHGNTNTYRKITRNSVSIPKDLVHFFEKLELKYSFQEDPLKLNDETRPRSDVVKEIYGFYPEILLKSIGEYSQQIDEILNLPKLIEEYSNNNDGKQAYLFENVLEKGFNQFYNVSAKKIGGAGNVDLECIYLERNKKFSVDAKSTKNKLSIINSGRLNHHRDIIGSKYTIVITPRYVPAVLH